MGKWNLPLSMRIENNSMPVTDCGCQIWLGTKNSRGYGLISVNKKVLTAHRASWIAFRGNVPNEMHVLHHCDVKLCVNPDHLFIGTHKDNMDDRDRKGRNKPRPGILNSNAKLTVADILAIRSSSDGCCKLAKKYGMNKTSMARIRSGKRWKCVQ